jgi:hypothetical protein
LSSLVFSILEVLVKLVGLIHVFLSLREAAVGDDVLVKLLILLQVLLELVLLVFELTFHNFFLSFDLFFTLGNAEFDLSRPDLLLHAVLKILMLVLNEVFV